MDSYTDETYGERIAGVYDELHTHIDPHTIELLAGLAANGRALELGIGTGRIALPLVAKGVSVTGIDASQSMVDRLKSKPGSEHVNVHLGSFADVQVDGEFNVVYVVFNTFFALGTQEAQVRCFRNVATHLTANGCFLIEAFVPDLNRFTGGQVNWATKVTEEQVQLDVGQHDSATQRVTSQKLVITEGNVRLYPVQLRYAWPSELDLMAQLAGLRLRERWSNWDRAQFNSTSGKHISIYERVD